MHDKCWDSLEQSIPNCSPFWVVYDYTRNSNNDIQCTDPVGTCDYGTCQCDKAAVSCFSRHRNTSYDSDFSNWKGVCTETFNAPEFEGERCPAVWNNREKYSNGSLVSFHGIKYQSLYAVGPGGHPESNAATSHLLGVTTWKKLGQCRRTNMSGEL